MRSIHTDFMVVISQNVHFKTCGLQLEVSTLPVASNWRRRLSSNLLFGHRKPGTEVQRNVATKLCVCHSSPPRCRKCSSRMWTTAIHGMKSSNGSSSISDVSNQKLSPDRPASSILPANLPICCFGPRCHVYDAYKDRAI